MVDVGGGGVRVDVEEKQRDAFEHVVQELVLTYVAEHDSEM